MTDDSCPKCGYTVQSDWNTCPLCSVSLGAGTAVEVTGHDDITVVGSEKVEIRKETHHHGADPQKVADLEKMVNELKEKMDAFDFSTPSEGQPAEVDEETQAELDSILADAQDVEDAGHEFDPWDEIELGDAAALAGRTNTARRYYARALEDFKKSGDRDGEARSLGYLCRIAFRLGDIVEAEQLQKGTPACQQSAEPKRFRSMLINSPYCIDNYCVVLHFVAMFRHSIQSRDA